MGKATTSEVPADKLALYDRLLATNPNVERKGDALPYTSLNGHMFSFLTPSGRLALRLPQPARREFLERYQTTLCEEHGAAMSEYVNVPETLFENVEEMSKHFDVAYMYVATLQPNPTTRTSKRAKTTRTSAARDANGAAARATRGGSRTARSAAKKAAKRPAKPAKPAKPAAKKAAKTSKKAGKKAARAGAKKIPTKAAAKSAKKAATAGGKRRPMGWRR